MAKWQGIYRIHDADSQRVQIALRELEGYYKTLSMLYLHMLRLPVLDGFIFTCWQSTFKYHLRQFCSEYGVDTFLVRADKRNEVPGSTMRGGYIIEAKDAKRTVCELLKQGRIAILLEPVSPYEDLYSINALFEAGNDILLEVVGPGFDASDLQKGDITPHQCIEIANLRRAASSSLSPLDIRQKYITSQEEYRRSVLVRLEKIGKRFKGLPITNHVSRKQQRELTEAARNYLQSTGKTLLLNHEQEYVSIPIHYLRRIYHYICDLPERLAGIGVSSKSFVVAMTIFESGRLNFWDIFWPDRRYALTWDGSLRSMAQ